MVTTMVKIRTHMQRFCRFFLFGLLCLNTAAVRAGELQYFRADKGVGHLVAALPDDFNAPESLNWRVPLDGGHSTPSVDGGKIFVTTYRADSKELATVALEQGSGKMLWRNPIVPELVEETHPIGSPATATVACDGKHVYAFFGSAGLFCYDLNGKKIWDQRMGPLRDEYGAGSSPILFDGKIILNQDHDIDSFLAAYDCATGRQIWKVARPDAVRSYSTPCVWTNNGKPELLVAGALQLTAYDPVNGEKSWWMNGLARIVIPTPVPSGGMIYMASWAPGGDPGKRIALPTWADALSKWDSDHDGKLAKAEINDHDVLDRFFRMDLNQDGFLNQQEWERHAAVFKQAQNALLAIKATGRGELPASAVIWKHGRGVPYVATPVLEHGALWMVKDGGIVTKLETDTGKLLQEERVPAVGNYFASPVAGDGKVYFCSEPGTVSVVSAEKDWRVISSRDFHEKIYATPVLVGNHIYLRTEEALYCFEGGRSKVTNARRD
jgi:outer membrane protein assembly factor BamB